MSQALKMRSCLRFRFHTIVILAILVCGSGCRHRRKVTEQYPFRNGCYSLAWGLGAASIDSLVQRDSSWSKISSVTNSQTNGMIVVARRKHCDYYLDFTENDKFYAMNYIAERSRLDSIAALLRSYYGEPDRLERSGDDYENRIWSILGDSVNLQIELLTTKKNYSLKVVNRNITN
jgi:hypothetical protein